MAQDERTREELLAEISELHRQVEEITGKGGIRFADDVRYHASLVQNVSDAIISTDLDFNIKSWNRAAEAIYGWRAEEAVGKPVHVVTRLEYPYDSTEAVVEAFRREGRWKGEVVQRHKGGRAINVMASVSLVRDAAGNPVGAVSINRDITERRRAEEQLRAVVSHSPIPTAVGDSDGSIISINKAMEELTGYQRSEIHDVTDWANKLYPDPEYRASVWENIQQALRGEQQDCTEFTITRKDGQKRVGCFETASFEGGLIIQVVDITGRKRAEEELRRSEERHRTLFETMAQGIVYQNAQGVITSANPAAERILGLSLDQMQGRTSIDPRWRTIHEDGSAFPGETHPSMVALRTGKEVTNAVMGVFSPREEAHRWISIHAIPQFRPGEDRPYQVYTTFDDITERRRAEEELREGELRYRQLFERAPIGIGLANLDGKPVDANEAMVAITGYSREELMDVDLGDTYEVPEDRATLLDALKRHGRVGDFRTRLRRKDGTSYDASLSISVVRLGHEELLQTTCVDVSERERTQRVLQESEDRYRILAESADDFIFRIGPDLRVEYVNEAGARSLGKGVEDILGCTVDEVFPAETAKHQRASLLHVLQTGQVVATESLHQLAAGERWLGTKLSPLRNEAGDVVGVLGLARDVTERKRAEEELRESQRMLRLVLDTIPAFVFWKDRDSVYLGANRNWAEAVGLGEPDNVVGKTDYDTFPDRELADSYREWDRRVMETDTPVLRLVEKWYRADDEEERWAETSKVPLHDEKGKVVGILGTYEDITERRKLEEQLLHAQKMEAIGTLASGIAHDFNNLLTPVVGFADMLMLEAEAESRIFRAASTIKTAGQRASELAQQLLGFARKGKLLTRPVDIHRIVGEAVAILGRTVDKLIAISLRLEADPPMVIGDPSQLEQVVMNLAVNASDAMPEGGELTFQTSNVELDDEYCRTHAEVSPGSYVLVAVNDTGIGMAEEVRSRAFEPFFTTKPEGKGTGMGLAMVYGIVKNHGGSVGIYSEVGSGTTVKVYLPVARDASRRPVSGRMTAPIRGAGTILVVDDEKGVRQVVESMLTSLGYEVVLAESGQEAVDYYKIHGVEIDLVVLDLTMPVMGGLICFRELRNLDPEVKVVVATGHALNGAAQTVLDEGALRFIQKPFVKAELSEAVTEALAGDRTQTGAEEARDEADAQSPADIEILLRQLTVEIQEIVSLFDTARETEGVGEESAHTLANLAAQLGQQLSRAIVDTVTSEVRHEIGNQLLASQLFVRSLKNALAEGSPARNAVVAIEDRTARAIVLVNRWRGIADASDEPDSA